MRGLSFQQHEQRQRQRRRPRGMKRLELVLGKPGSGKTALVRVCVMRVGKEGGAAACCCPINRSIRCGKGGESSQSIHTACQSDIGAAAAAGRDGAGRPCPLPQRAGARAGRGTYVRGDGRDFFYGFDRSNRPSDPTDRQTDPPRFHPTQPKPNPTQTKPNPKKQGLRPEPPAPGSRAGGLRGAHGPLALRAHLRGVWPPPRLLRCVRTWVLNCWGLVARRMGEEGREGGSLNHFFFCSADRSIDRFDPPLCQNTGARRVLGTPPLRAAFLQVRPYVYKALIACINIDARVHNPPPWPSH